MVETISCFQHAQKELAQIKIDAAEKSMNESDPLKRKATLVIDYCQNVDLPHLWVENNPLILIITHQFGYTV